MPHYMFTAKYTDQGLKGLLKEGSAARITVVETLLESLGRRLEAAYWSFGESDFVVIAELPDNAAAATAATTVAASGTGSVNTTVLLTPAEIDEARGRTATFRAAGN